MAARLSRTMREMEQLKMDHEVAIEKKEKQVLVLSLPPKKKHPQTPNVIVLT